MKMQPQEIEVWYIIPAIRKELALALLSHKLKQKEVAGFLGLQESTVSQYIKNKRGNEVKMNKKIKDEIKKSAKRIIKNKNLVIIEIQRICHLLKKNKFLCKVHKSCEGIQKDCCVCLR